MSISCQKGVKINTYSTARKYWCISTWRNLVRRHFVFLEFAVVGQKP